MLAEICITCNPVSGHDCMPEPSVNVLKALCMPFITGDYNRVWHKTIGVWQRGQPYRSSPSAELKLLLRLLSLEAAPGEPAERSGSVPKGESGSSIRISSSRCSSLSVALKKSVKWDSGSEKVVQPSAPGT